MDKQKVASVVVTYNRKELLKENIESLLNQKCDLVALDILVIDNASTDGTKEYIHKYIDSNKIIYINTGSNLGGAGGFNFGIKYAAGHNYDYIWVMDDDCMPTETALSEFMKYDRKLNGNYGFLSSKILWKDKSICKMNVQRKTLTKYVDDFNSDIIQITMASFVSCFIPSKIVKEMGLPIKEFFIWTDDWEYTRRISRKYKCYLIPSSVCIHKSKSNFGANIATEGADRLDRYNYLYRNDVYLYRREGFKGFAYEFVRLNGHALRVLLKAKDNKMKRMGYIIRGTKNGFKFNPKIEFVK